MAWIPLKDQTSLSGRSIKTYYVGMAGGHKGGILLYNPLTKHTIIRRSYKVMGPAEQSPSVLQIEATEFKPDVKSINTDENKNIVSLIDEDIMPELVGGDESDDEDDENEKTIKSSTKNNETILNTSIQEEFYEHPFGKDHCLEADPSDRPIIQHIPLISKTKKLKPGEFYVEKIINHKGTTNKRSSMKFFVKWHGYDDSHNSWIPWSEAKNLAALETYLKNNVDILIPVERAYSTHVLNVKDKEKLKNDTFTDFIYKDLPYVINYRPPKTVAGACKEDAY